MVWLEPQERNQDPNVNYSTKGQGFYLEHSGIQIKSAVIYFARAASVAPLLRMHVRSFARKEEPQHLLLLLRRGFTHTKKEKYISIYPVLIMENGFQFSSFFNF